MKRASRGVEGDQNLCVRTRGTLAGRHATLDALLRRQACLLAASKQSSSPHTRARTHTSPPPEFEHLEHSDSHYGSLCIAPEAQPIGEARAKSDDVFQGTTHLGRFAILVWNSEFRFGIWAGEF